MNEVKKIIKKIENKKKDKKKTRLKEFLRIKNMKFIKKIFEEEYTKHIKTKYDLKNNKIHHAHYNVKELYEQLLKKLKKENHPPISFEEFLIDLEEIEKEEDMSGFCCSAGDDFGFRFSYIIELIDNNIVVYYDGGY